MTRLALAAAALLLAATAVEAQAPVPSVQTPGSSSQPLIIQSPTGPPQVPMPPGMQAPAPGPGPAPTPNLWESRGTADIVALDKVDDRVANLSVAVGQSATFYHLTIMVRACVVRPTDQPADASAYLDIEDSRPTQPGFHGWMLANEPGASLLQHPVYDVRVTGCH